MTGRELITAALRKIGAIASSEALSADEATDGLAEANRMLGSWSADGLMIHYKVRETLVLTASDGSYTVGSSGNLNTTRPVKIVSASILDTSQTPNVERPIRVISLAEWVRIAAKDVNGLPYFMYPDMAFPLLTVNLYPRPSSTAYTLVLWSEKALTEIATLDTSISLPPGYDDALIHNLAIRLAPEYGKAPSEALYKLAEETKSNLMRQNIRPTYLTCDSALVSGGAFDIYTGGQ